MADPLFDSENPQSAGQNAAQRESVPSPAPLFQEQKSPAPSLFSESAIQDQASRPAVNPLFSSAEEPPVCNPPGTNHQPLFAEPKPDHPPVAASSPAPKPEPLLPPDPLVAPPKTPVTNTVPPVAAIPPEPLTAPPVHQEPKANAAFGDDLDPLAGRAWKILQEKYPQATDSQRLHWKGMLRQLFPLTMDTIQQIGGPGLRHAPHVLEEIANDTRRFAELSPAQTIQGIADQAREAAGQGKKSGGLSGLLSKVESAFSHFDATTANGRMIALRAAIHAISGRMQPTKELAQTTLDAITDDLPVLSALLELSKGSPSEAWVVRRQELLLTSAQQMKMAIQQAEHLENQCNSAIQSVDELRTVTLPALGFLQTMRS